MSACLPLAYLRLTDGLKIAYPTGVCIDCYRRVFSDILSFKLSDSNYSY